MSAVNALYPKQTVIAVAVACGSAPPEALLTRLIPGTNKLERGVSKARVPQGFFSPEPPNELMLDEVSNLRRFTNLQRPGQRVTVMPNFTHAVVTKERP